MTALALWNPGEQVLIWGINVLLQVTLVAAIALLVAASARRSPAVRYGILCSSLLLTLLSPAIATVMQLSGRSLFSVSLMREAAASAIDMEADMASVEPQSLEMPPPPLPFDNVADTSPDARGSTTFEFDPSAAEQLGREGEHQADAVTETEITSVSPLAEPKSPPGAFPAPSMASLRGTTWMDTILRIVMPLVLLVWVAGAAVLLARLAIGWRRLAGVLRSARPNTNALLTEAFKGASRALGIRHMPELVVSQQVPGPVAAGLLRPCVILPERIVDRVSPEQLREILVHELAHVLRRDPAVVLLQNVSAAIFWLHPLVKVLNRQLSQAREEVCDNYVLAATDAPSYSRTLLALAEMVQSIRQLPGTVGLLTSRWKLEHRVAGLLDERRSRMTGLTARGKSLVVALLLVMTTIAAFGTMKLAVVQTKQNDATVGGREVNAADVSEALPTNSADFKAQTPMPPAEAADQPVANLPAGKAGDTITIRGRVVGPDGEPLRAQLWLGSPPRTGDWHPVPQSIEWTPQAQSSDEGQFELSIDRKNPIAERTGTRPVSIRIAATADGLGFAWADVKSDKAADKITLQLVNDIPIQGRFLTSDGQPVPGIKLHISQIYANTAKVDDIVKNASRHSGVYTNWPAWPGGSPTSEPIVTDADGRFHIKGLGANRWVRFEALGGGIGATRLAILTHAPPPDAAANGAIAVREGLRESTYFARFIHITVPGRMLRGLVTDAESRRPIAGVRIRVNSSWASRKNPAVTGPDGRYEITSVPKAADYEVELEPTRSLHFNKRMKVTDPPGLEPIEVNVSLPTGIRVRGRVTDAESGAAVPGTVIYNPLFPNDHIARLGEQFQIANPASSARINEDGSYELSVLPGPGAIAAQIDHNRFVTAAVETDELKALVGDSVDVNEHGEVRFLKTAAGGQARGIMGLSQFQTAALLNPTDNMDAIAIDLTVVPSRSRPGMIVDQGRKPLAGVDVIGLGASGSTRTREPLESAAFEIEGLSTGRRRTLLFVHRERALGAKLLVTGDEMSPITVRLSPTGTIRGRLVDQFGEPIQNGNIELMPADPPLSGSGFWDARVDEDGRFRVGGLINDCGYSVHARTPEHRMTRWVTNVKVAGGQTVDLGEFQEQDEYRFMPIGKTENQGNPSENSGRPTPDDAPPGGGASLPGHKSRGDMSPKK